MKAHFSNKFLSSYDGNLQQMVNKKVLSRFSIRQGVYSWSALPSQNVRLSRAFRRRHHMTALHVAATYGSQRCIEFLLGADIRGHLQKALCLAWRSLGDRIFFSVKDHLLRPGPEFSPFSPMLEKSLN